MNPSVRTRKRINELIVSFKHLVRPQMERTIANLNNDKNHKIQQKSKILAAFVRFAKISGTNYYIIIFYYHVRLTIFLSVFADVMRKQNLNRSTWRRRRSKGLRSTKGSLRIPRTAPGDREKIVCTRKKRCLSSRRIN